MPVLILPLPIHSRQMRILSTHSQEMSEEVCAAHIKLYVNEFSLELGPEGEAAVINLIARAE